MDDVRVRFLDLQARIQPIRDELVDACARIIDSGVFVMGPETAALEDEFASYCGVRHAVAVSNGTAALQVALLAAGVGPGDEVITVSNTFIATVEAISAVGATPVLVDIEPDTYVMDAGRLEAAITERTRAVIPVHLYGLPVDMHRINEVARRHGLTVIEDACQAHGATIDGARTGSFGDMACFSFYPSKNMGTIGEGGIVVTNDAALATRMRSLRSHGELTRYYHNEPGWNLRLAEIPAAAARIQLRHLDAWNAGRQQVAHWYAQALAGLPLVQPCIPAGREHVYHLYVVQVEQRESVRERLLAQGVQTAVHYPLPVHQQLAYASVRVAPGSLAVTERVATRQLSLPMYSEMNRDHVDIVAQALRDALTDSPRNVEPIEALT